MDDQPAKGKWYQSDLAAVLLLFFFFPVGLYLMWKYTKWNKYAKWGITGFFGVLILGSVAGGSKTATTTTIQPTQAPESQASAEPTQTQVVTQTPISLIPTKVSAKATTAPAKQTASSGSVSQANAVKKAKSYLSYTGFSRDGLVDQLEFDQFSHEDAVYGADNSGANWNEEAAQKAKSYMSYSAFSRGSLIDQLKFDKFTQEQAEYGANAVGL